MKRKPVTMTQLVLAVKSFTRVTGRDDMSFGVVDDGVMRRIAELTGTPVTTSLHPNSRDGDEPYAIDGCWGGVDVPGGRRVCVQVQAFHRAMTAVERAKQAAKAQRIADSAKPGPAAALADAMTFNEPKDK